MTAMLGIQIEIDAPIIICVLCCPDVLRVLAFKAFFNFGVASFKQ